MCDVDESYYTDSFFRTSDVGPAERDSSVEELIFELEDMRLDRTPCPRCGLEILHERILPDGSHDTCTGFRSNGEYKLPLWVRILKRIL